MATNNETNQIAMSTVIAQLSRAERDFELRLRGIPDNEQADHALEQALTQEDASGILTSVQCGNDEDSQEAITAAHMAVADFLHEWALTEENTEATEQVMCRTLHHMNRLKRVSTLENVVTARLYQQCETLRSRYQFDPMLDSTGYAPHEQTNHMSHDDSHTNHTPHTSHHNQSRETNHTVHGEPNIRSEEHVSRVDVSQTGTNDTNTNNMTNVSRTSAAPQGASHTGIMQPGATGNTYMRTIHIGKIIKTGRYVLVVNQPP